MRSTFPVPPPRGFGWPLVAVERQREHQLEQARMRWGIAHRELEAGERVVHLLQAEQRQLLDGMTSAQGVRIDTTWRCNAMGHLRVSLARQKVCEERRDSLQVRLDEVRRDCTLAQQRLDAVRKLKEAALASYLRTETRREAREADLAWLVRRTSGEGKGRVR